MSHPVVFFFQLSLKGPPGAMGLAGRPGPLVRHSSDLDHHTSRAPATFYLNFTFCLTRHKLHSLPLILTSLLCMLSMFEWPWLWNHCRVAKMNRFVKWSVLSSFVFCLFGAKFEWRVELLLYIMNSCFYFAGSSRSQWAQRRQRRQWPSCKIRHYF